ncbi:MAG TPA: site-specific DNA-methyltransferase [Thermoplasmata archaeon]|nr:site-specific DNA-methyltransferase [Thermoplasmata archaeon]
MASAPAPFATTSGPRGSPVTLYALDSVRGMPRILARRSVDVVVTSPPYNLGVDYADYDDERPRAEYLRWAGEFGRSVDRVLSERGSFFLNLGGPPSDPGWPWEVVRAVGRPFRLQNVIHWVKSIAIDRTSLGRSSGLDRDLAIGHYKPVNSARFLNSAHEYVFHLTRRGDVPLDRLAIGVPYQDRSNVRRWKGGGSGVRCRGNTWFLPYPTIRSRSTDRPHPASFPTELPERCLRLHGLSRIALSVDPFLGIGASAEAAARLGVPFVGFELDQSYLAEALRTVERARTSDGPSDPPTTVGSRRGSSASASRPARRPAPASTRP